MIKYFIDRKTDKKITGIVTKDEKNIFIDNKKINAIDYIIIECDICGIEQKAVFKRRKKYFKDKVICTKCHKKEINIEKYGTEWPTQSKQIRDKTEKTCLKRYGTKVPNAFGSLEYKESIKNKYGTENINSVEEIKNRIKQTNEERYGGLGRASSIIRNKIDNTKLERYGDKNYTNREKSSRTIKDRYGVDNISQLKKTQKIIKENNLKKYGVENTTQLNAVQNKMKQTCLENWGVKNPNQNQSIIERRQKTFIKNHGVSSIAQLDKSKQTMLDRYGATIKNSCKWFTLNEQKLQGKFELKVAQFLVDKNINFITHEKIQPISYLNKDNNESLYYPDFHLPDYDLYLEPHAKYFWDDNFIYKMDKVEEKINILYFDEYYNVEEVLLSLSYQQFRKPLN